MGNQCCTFKKEKEKRKDKKEVEKKKNDDGGEKSSESSLLVKVRDKTKRLEEDTLHSPAEQTFSEIRQSTEKTFTLANEYVTVKLPIQSSSALMSPTAEEKEAHWVDNNRADLIQRITSVMPIADQMLQRRIIHKEMYDQIRTTSKSQDQMRELFRGLNCVTAKSAFFKTIRKTQPEICEAEDIKDFVKKNKEYLRKKCTWELEGTERAHKEMKSLDQIYTDLHVVQGESELINKQHEIWEIEDKFRKQSKEGININCNDIFKSEQVDNVLSGSTRTEVRAMRTVMTKGIAGIGKTVSVKKFILDWADGKANPDLDFIFMFPFRELNLVKDDEFSLDTLVIEFHPDLKNIAVAKIFAECKVLFIFDGLDESQLELNFQTTKRLTDPTKKSSVDILVTNLIREHLLPSALVWITSRPGAVQRIPKKHIYQWTEVKGFNDLQKLLYFRNRVENKMVAEKMINHIQTSRTLLIMCHIPIFCWIASKVFEHLLLEMGNNQEENTKIPTTLIEMYTYFFSIQMRIAVEKYEKNELDTEDIFNLNKEFIFKLGRMAFEKLDKGEIIFSNDDLKDYGLDIEKAGVHCGLCTAIFKQESVFNSKKLYCFVHLTVQEYFAALFVYRSFASKTIASQSLKNFLLIGSEAELATILNAHPVDMPLDELIEIAIANSTLRKTGELDMFLRFLIGMSLQSTQDLLPGLIPQTEDHSEVVESIRTSLTELDLLDCSPDRCLNLVHCLGELKDDSLYDSVRQFLNPKCYPDTPLTPVQCSALADLMLMSTTPIEEFDLKKYTTGAKGVFRIIPAVRNSRKARITGLDLDPWICETISLSLWNPHSALTELHLIHHNFYDNGTKILIDGLKHSQCKLEALSLSGYGFSETLEKDLASAIKSVLSNLRQLELSTNILTKSLLSVISDALRCQKLKKLRLSRNFGISKICNEIKTAFESKLPNLRELELSYVNLSDSEMEILSSVISTSCMLENLSLRHNRVTEKGCGTLASALISRPSCLRELDLSYNDLHDAGVNNICNALKNENCGLKTLRLSFCKVTEKGCSSLGLALISDVCCKLMELDLSFNHLTEEGIKILTQKQTDPHCSLENLNVDQDEECWVKLKLLQQYACDLMLDENTAGENIILTQDYKEAHFVHEKREYPYHPDRFDNAQVLCKESLTDRHYWEVEVDLETDAEIGVAYKSIPRGGDSSHEYSLGRNEKSWSWSLKGTFYHNGSIKRFLLPKITTIGVYLDWPAGILSFFEVNPNDLTHLYTVKTTFTEPLCPGFELNYGPMYIKRTKKEGKNENLH